MNVNTIIVPREEAERKLEQYKNVTGKRRIAEDEKLQSLYAAVSKGARVLHLLNAFHQTGLNEKGEPRLAIIRADFKQVWCHRRSNGSALFGPSQRYNSAANRKNISLPEGTFGWPRGMSWSDLSSPVPHIPPDARPKFGLHNYHIMFEVKEWRQYPVDPFLMRRIAGNLFIVEAEWELTELEASLLASIETGN